MNRALTWIPNGKYRANPTTLLSGQSIKAVSIF